MQEVINNLSKELNLSKEVIKQVYKSYWVFIKTHISNLPLKEELTEEQFNKLRTNFNLPYLGKLYCNYNRWAKIKSIYNKNK